MIKDKRIMISGIRSGSGKTTVVAGILMALKAMGLDVRGFKSGPDYIDPMFHKRTLGIPSRNLDPWFTEDDTLIRLYGRGAGDGISVIEGAMGYYDGISFEGDEGSSYTVSKTLKCPVILVIDAKGMSYTAAGVLKGVKEFREDSRIRGVVFNNVSEGVYERLSETVRRETGLIPLGFLPHLPEIGIKSRHLGLFLPEEISDIEPKLKRLREETEKNIDIEAILKIAEEAEPLEYEDDNEDPYDGRYQGIRIGVALDSAFSFYYEDNLELLKKCGAEIVFFSPMGDSGLPVDVDGVIIGGGYPEVYAKELSENKPMLSDIRERLSSGLPCLAECGGFMYLHETVEGLDGKEYEMVGVFKGEKAYKADKLQRFGYVSLYSAEENPLLKEGESIRGHEFHYFKSTDNGSLMKEIKPSDKQGKKGWLGMRRFKEVFAGFPHLYYYSNKEFIHRFLELCRGNDK